MFKYVHIILFQHSHNPPPRLFPINPPIMLCSSYEEIPLLWAGVTDFWSLEMMACILAEDCNVDSVGCH